MDNVADYKELVDEIKSKGGDRCQILLPMRKMRYRLSLEQGEDL